MAEGRRGSGARIALVTGASAGIGLYTAIGLARAGFRVVMAGRDAARIDEARRRVERTATGAETAAALADFASLAAVRGLAENVLAQHDRLDVLVNNAGFIAREYRKSADGYELTFAVNHLAPFLLTNLLLDRLHASAPSRIVTVASQAHRGARIDPASLAAGPADWSPLKAYGQSKLCNILFTRTLARRLAGSDVFTACLHPGVIATKIGDRAGALTGLGWRLVKPFLAGPEKGAETSLFHSCRLGSFASANSAGAAAPSWAAAVGPNCSFSTRRSRSRPATGRAFSAAATPQMRFAAPGPRAAA